MGAETGPPDRDQSLGELVRPMHRRTHRVGRTSRASWPAPVSTSSPSIPTDSATEPAGFSGRCRRPPAKIGFPLANARISETSLRALDHLQRAVLDRWKPLPLPSTFLIDGKGELVAIYKGPVHAAQLLADVKLARADANQRRAAATPFDGVWVDDTAGRADPKRVANLMLDHDEIDAAILYLDRCARILSPQKTLPGYERELGDIHYMAGVLKNGSATHRAGAIASLTAARDLIPTDLRIRKALAQQLFGTGQGEEAATEMRAAIKINPADLNLRAELADLYERLGQFAKAKGVLDELLAINPKHAPARYSLAGVLLKLGDPRSAIQQYKQTLTDSPRLLEAADKLARILASHPEDAVRSPDEALALARRLCALTGDRDPAFLDTLAIALANKGNFKEAITVSEKALTLLPPENEAASSPLLERIELYKAGRPYRGGQNSPSR